MANTEALSSLAFLYLTLSHATDGQLAIEEMRTLGDKLKDWAPDIELAEVGKILQAAVGEYKGVPEADRLSTARQKAAGLASISDAGARVRIISELEAIAGADGAVSEGELAFINELKAQFAQ